MIFIKVEILKTMQSQQIDYELTGHMKVQYKIFLENEEYYLKRFMFYMHVESDLTQ